MRPDGIIWDWNGTLLDDVDSAVNALNRMLGARGIPPTTLSYYRDHFGFLVRPFYAELGVDLEHDDWDGICIDFHRFVAEEPKRLRGDAREALALAHGLGMRQCILSALREDMLLRDVAAAGIADFFEAVYGVDNLDGATKLSRGHELMWRIEESGRPSRLFFVGDTLHDAEVARELGARCVLVEGGHQAPGRLAAADVPVVASLVDAVRLMATPTRPQGRL